MLDKEWEDKWKNQEIQKIMNSVVKGIRDRDEANSLKMISLFNAIRTFDPSIGVLFTTYLVGILKNAVYKEYGNITKHKNIIERLKAQNKKPYYEDKENWANEEISLLNKREKEILKMKFVNQSNIKEIAEDKGLSKSYVKAIIRNGLAKMYKRWKS